MNQGNLIHNQAGKIEHLQSPKTFAAQDSLNRHFPVDLESCKFWCDLCQSGFTQKTLLEDHVRKHEGRLYKCQYCTKCFQTRTGLRLHLPEHTSNFRFSCDACQKGFDRKEVYEKHMRKHYSLFTNTIDLLK